MLRLPLCTISALTGFAGQAFVGDDRGSTFWPVHVRPAQLKLIGDSTIIDTQWVDLSSAPQLLPIDSPARKAISELERAFKLQVQQQRRSTADERRGSVSLDKGPLALDTRRVSNDRHWLESPIATTAEVANRGRSR